MSYLFTTIRCGNEFEMLSVQQRLGVFFAILASLRETCFIPAKPQRAQKNAEDHLSDRPRINDRALIAVFIDGADAKKVVVL